MNHSIRVFLKAPSTIPHIDIVSDQPIDMSFLGNTLRRDEILFNDVVIIPLENIACIVRVDSPGVKVETKNLQ